MHRIGLMFGLLAGLAYTISTFGYDTYVLLQVLSNHAWIKLVISIPVFLLFSIIASWLTAHYDSSLVGFLVWMLAGISIAWFSGHLPYEGITTLVGLSDPRVRSLDVYPFVWPAQVRMVIAIVFAGGISGLAGVFQPVFHERVHSSVSILGQLITLSLWMLLFILAGISIDNLINQPLRDPLIVVDRLIQLAEEAQRTPVDPQVALDRHLGAARAIEDFLAYPRRLALGDYDQYSQVSVSVNLDFSGNWARCWVVANQPTYCQKSEQIYQQIFTCLLNSNLADTNSCNLLLSEKAYQWFLQEREAIGDVPQVSLSAQYGAVTLVELHGTTGFQYDCLFRGTQPIFLETCTSGQN